MKGTFMLLNLLLFSLTFQNHLVYAQLSNYTTYTPIARYLNVSESEVPQLLAQEKILIEGNRVLTPLLTQNGQIFGGSYIDIIAYKININTKDLSKNGTVTNNPAMKPYLDLLSFIQAKNSLYDLNSTFEDLTTLAKENNATNVLLSNEYKVNNIVIYLRHADDMQNKEFIADAIKLNSIIIYEESEIKVPNNNSVEFPPISNLVFAGDGMHTFGYTIRCTAGFWVRSRLNSTSYIMTAGHCSKNGPFNPDGSVDFYHMPWSRVAYRLIGPMAPPNMSVVDKGLISKQNDNIGVIPSVRNIDDPEFPELRIYGTVDMDTVGSIVCKSGYFTHVDCGEILSLDATILYADDRQYSGVVKISHMGCEGDSGAPVFQFIEDLLPGIFITGMITSGSITQGICAAVPIALLITDDVYILTINDFI